MKHKIRVLIVDDSAVAREFLAGILGGDSGIEIAGTARNGREAIDAVRIKKPDVVTMDINMPVMDGLEATRKIMELQPTPIVMVTANADIKEVATTFRAMEAGALAVMSRPPGIACDEYEPVAKELVQTVKLMSEIKVVRRWPRKAAPGDTMPEVLNGIIPRQRRPRIRAVAIGASTGGPAVLQTILSNLPSGIEVPILVTQHIAPGFVAGLAQWLHEVAKLPVRVASDGEIIEAGTVYIAPDHFHMGLRNPHQIALSESPPEMGLRPSVSFLFRSVAEVFAENAIGVVLTGMGRDGAEGLKLMKDAGAVTIAQNKETAIVDGMPQEAARLNAAVYIFSPEEIATTIAALTNRGANNNSAHKEKECHERF